ncbi:MAG: TetR/AcrR family transcriptional regulator [Chloroflexi bacterium]|nr:TetR/AcrR family transcriptional regulator [Chloroflexota bacterium]
MEKVDRRIRRTRNQLGQALRELIIEKSYEAITIQDIADRADVNRATFYLHYGTKEELLVTSLTEIFDELVVQMEAQAEGKPPWESMVHAEILFEHIAENFALYQAVLGQNGLGYVMHRILAYIAAHEEKELRAYFGDAAAPPLPIPILAHHVAGSIFALASWWVENNRPYSPTEMAVMLQQLCVQGMGTLGGNS